jgi:hypothetical protein
MRVDLVSAKSDAFVMGNANDSSLKASAFRFAACLACLANAAMMNHLRNFISITRMAQKSARPLLAQTTSAATSVTKLSKCRFCQ